MWRGPPKTSASIRVISLPPFLIELLREHCERTDAIPVFAGPQGGWLRRSNIDWRALRPAADGTLLLAHATVRFSPVRPGLTFHGLRHSHKTWLIADGVPEIAQARRLGHHLEARWHAANAYLHSRRSQTTFRTLLTRMGHWRNTAA